MRIRYAFSKNYRALGCLVFGATMAMASFASAQSFNSGSNGEDGAFDLTGRASGTVVDFKPEDFGIDRDGDHVFHFTTITIPAGVTVRMSAKWTNGPIYWLATGAVNIAGTINLSGENGHPASASSSARFPNWPGPGGFAGGIGGNYASGSRGGSRSGFGPGGGRAYPINGWPQAHGEGAKLVANEFLVPLIGGSGGGGGSDSTYEWWGAGGGAGGGAILVSSSVSIEVASGATIRADGGSTGSGGTHGIYGGGGCGGSIRLIAPILQGGGLLTTNPGGSVNNSSTFVASYGRARLEAYQHNQNFTLNQTNWTKASPFNSYVPNTKPPRIEVTQIAGQTIAASPTGSFDTADVTINTNTPVQVVIRAHQVPTGTIPKVYLNSLDGNDQTIDAPPLTGTYEDSTSTVMATFPNGYSRGYVRAVWTPAP